MTQRFGLSNVSLTLSNTVTLKKEERPLVRITPTAYCKMMAVVQSTTSEIAWHGICHRVNTGEYVISDILVYPQKAASATVESDDEHYPQWVMGLTEEQHNNMRFQGHSHVMMGTTPSGTDEKNWTDFLQGFDGDDFYVFAIFNKKYEFHFRIFDYKDNAIYENTEIDFEIDLDDQMSMAAWAEDMTKTYLKKSMHFYTPPVIASRTTIPLTGTYGGGYVPPPARASFINEDGFDDYEEALKDPFYYSERYVGALTGTKNAAPPKPKKEKKEKKGKKGKEHEPE